MDEAFAQLVNVGRDVCECVEGEEFDYEDIGRLLWIVSMRADEMVQFQPAPTGVDIVLREQQQEEGALLDLCPEIVAEYITRLETMVDEQVFSVVVRPGVQVVGERRYPAVLYSRP